MDIDRLVDELGLMAYSYAEDLIKFADTVRREALEEAAKEQSAHEALLRQVEFLLSVTVPMTSQQKEVWPELIRLAAESRSIRKLSIGDEQDVL